MFELLVGAIGAGIAKHLLGTWLGDGLPNTIGGELIGKLADKLGSRSKAERATNRIVEIRNAIIEDLEPFFDAERGQGDITRIAEALGRTLEAAPPTALLIKGRFDASATARAFAAACPDARASLDPAEQSFYDRALEATALALSEIAEKLPSFHRDVAEEQLRKLDQLATNVDTILANLRPIAADLRTIRDRPEHEAQGYESTYRRALRQKVASLRLFGLPHVDDAATELALEIAYIPLRLQHTGERLPLDLSYPEILALLPALGNRLLIEGAAGSGKTTILQWTAMQALADGDEQQDTHPTAEATIRRIADSLLHGMLRGSHPVTLHPLLQDLGYTVKADAVREIYDASDTRKPVAQHASLSRRGKPIDGPPWWQRLPIFLRLRDCPEGKLPSPDELPKVAAHEAGNAPANWLLHKLQNGEALLLIDGVDEVPEANRRALHASLGAYAEIYPKTLVIVTSRPVAVRAERWARSFRHRLAVEPMAADDIRAFIAQWHAALTARRPTTPADPDVEALTRQVLDTPSLRQLAETPLLCAAICYLNCIRRGDIPRRAIRIYAAVTEQLTHQLDLDRLRQDGYERLVPALKGLDLDDKLQLLARLALAMIRAEQSSLPHETALQPITEGLAVLRKDHDPNEVLAALQERSGVLRGASQEVVEFAHNILKTYLAARRLVAESATASEVLRLAEVNSDPDLVLLTSAQASIAHRENLIRALLNARAREHPTIRRRPQILALRCSVEAVEQSDLRYRLDALMPEVFPPRDLDEAAGLAELGDRAVPHLAHRPELEAAWNAASVRSLKRIATHAAAQALQTFLDTEEMAVASELADVFHPLQIRAVLKACCRENAVERLRYHHVFAIIRDVEPLKGHTDIRMLDLSNASLNDASLVDLMSMKHLQSLSLAMTEITDAGLEHLVGLQSLKSLALEATCVTDDGLRHISRIVSLEDVWLTNTQIDPNHPTIAALRARGVYVDV